MICEMTALRALVAYGLTSAPGTGEQKSEQLRVRDKMQVQAIQGDMPLVLNADATGGIKAGADIQVMVGFDLDSADLAVLYNCYVNKRWPETRHVELERETTQIGQYLLAQMEGARMVEDMARLSPAQKEAAKKALDQ